LVLIFLMDAIMFVFVDIIMRAKSISI